MRTPSSSAASAPGITQGRELSATELVALRLRRQRDIAAAVAVVAGIGLVGSVCESFYAWTHAPNVIQVVAPPRPPAPPPCESLAMIPDYEPTGDDAALKKEGARFVDVDDAWKAAGWLEHQLDGEIEAREEAREDALPLHFDFQPSR